MNENNVNSSNCSKCGSNDISLDIAIGKLKCNHCGNIIESKTYDDSVQNNDVQKEQSNVSSETIVSSGAKNINDEHVNIVVLNCPKCGESYFSGKNVDYSNCYICGSKLDISGEYENIDNVAMILPFTTSREEVVDLLKKEKGKMLKYTNKDFKNRFDENNIIGVYLPYIMIDANYHCVFNGQGERKVNINSDDNSVSYTVDLYDIKREFNIDAQDINLEYKSDVILDNDDAAKNIITAAYPFDTNNSLDLSGKYLKGFLAKMIKPEEVNMDTNLNNRLISVAKYAILDDINFYDRGVRWETTDISLNSANYTYTYLPVWVSIYKGSNNNPDEIYYVAVNGRTKEIVNHIPFNKGAGIKSALSSVLLFDFIVFIIGFLIYLFIRGVSDSMESSINLGLVFWCLLCLILIIIGNVMIFRGTYKASKDSSLGDNELSENDDLIKTVVNKVDYTDNKIKSFTTSKTEIAGINDNGKKRRQEEWMKNHNVKIIKR